MQKPIPDCMTCWKRETCERVQAGTFCTEWQSKTPPALRATSPDRGDRPTPDELWEQGETPFDDM